MIKSYLYKICGTGLITDKMNNSKLCIVESVEDTDSVNDDVRLFSGKYHKKIIRLVFVDFL